MQIVKVKLQKRSYDIMIDQNIISHCEYIFKEKFKSARIAIITDENLAKLHLKSLQQMLNNANIEFTTIIIPAGEQSKSFNVLQEILDKLLNFRLERNDCIFALGGGVVGDISGFAASILRRGTHFVQVPTSLLAQVDSSVGGKTGINTNYGKNLIGTFYQPKLVLIDTAVLDSLPPREFRSGYAEIVKYALINQADFFFWLEENWQGIFNGHAAREIAIARACQSKASIVSLDERENGSRALLNLGHTFGHALEALIHYDSHKLNHGEGVAMGTVLAYQFSKKLGFLKDESDKQIIKHFECVGLPTSLRKLKSEIPNASTLLQFILQDKKVLHGSLTFILTKGLGQAFIAPNIAKNDVLDFLQEKLDEL